MEQAHWLDPRDASALLDALMRALAGDDAWIAVEGDAPDLVALALDALPGAREGPVPPFRTEWRGPAARMVVVPLDADTLEPLRERLLVDLARIGAVQIARGGRVEFLAGDRFHRECVSVGPAVTLELLRGLVERGVLRAVD